MFADYQGQFCFPETYDTGRFFLFIFIDAQVNTGSQFVQIAVSLCFAGRMFLHNPDRLPVL